MILDLRLSRRWRWRCWPFVLYSSFGGTWAMTLGGAALTSVEKNSRPQLMSQRTSCNSVWNGDGGSMFLQTVGYRFMWTNSVSIGIWKSFFGVSVVSPFSGKNVYGCFPMPFWVYWIIVDTWQDSFGLGIRSSQRTLPRQDNTRQTSIPSAGFESAIPATERSRPAP
jgi:hypothetical protein